MLLVAADADCVRRVPRCFGSRVEDASAWNRSYGARSDGGMGSNRWWFLGGDAISLGFLAATVPTLLLQLLSLPLRGFVTGFPFTRRAGLGGGEWVVEAFRPFRFRFGWVGGDHLALVEGVLLLLLALLDLPQEMSSLESRAAGCSGSLERGTSSSFEPHDSNEFTEKRDSSEDVWDGGNGRVLGGCCCCCFVSVLRDRGGCGAVRSCQDRRASRAVSIGSAANLDATRAAAFDEDDMISDDLLGRCGPS